MGNRLLTLKQSSSLWIVPLGLVLLRVAEGELQMQVTWKQVLVIPEMFQIDEDKWVWKKVVPEKLEKKGNGLEGRHGTGTLMDLAGDPQLAVFTMSSVQLPW